MDFDKAVRNRKSVRNFSSKKPNWRAVIECIDAARYAPVAGKNFTLKFIMIQDKEKIQQLAKAAEQDFIAQAPYIIAVYSDNARLKNLFGEEKGEVYSRQQTGAAIQNILLSIEDHKLAGCWVGHYDEEEIKKLLKIPDSMTLEALIPVGYESERKKTKPKERINMDSILYFDQHGKKQMKMPFSPES